MTRIPRTLLVESEDSDKERRKHESDSEPLLLRVFHRNGQFFRVDGRSKAGRLLRDTRDALLKQLGRKPSTAERLLIERLSWLHLCTPFLDSKVLAGSVDIQEAATYSSQINSFSKGLANLGLLGNALSLPTLDEKTPKATDDGR